MKSSKFTKIPESGLPYMGREKAPRYISLSTLSARFYWSLNLQYLNGITKEAENVFMKLLILTERTEIELTASN